MQRKLSVAVIGAGMAGKAHADAWRRCGSVYELGLPAIRLAVIADTHLPTAKEAAGRYGYERATDDWREIVDDPSIDIVSIVVANRLHREMAQALIEAGKHVLCEKPLTDSLLDAAAMAQLEATTDRVTGLGFCFRRHPGIAKAAELISSGQLGIPSYFHGSYWCDYAADPKTPIAWRFTGPMGSGALGDIGSHLVDTAELICGPVVSVAGANMSTVITHRPPASGHLAGGRGATVNAKATEPVTNDDIATFTARFASGVIGTFSVSRVAFGIPNSLAFDVFGSAGRISFDYARSGEILLDDNCASEGIAGPRKVLLNPTFPYFNEGSAMAFAGVGFNQAEQFVYQAHAFIQQVMGVTEGALPPVASFAEGYRSMRILAAIVNSASNGGVEVEIV